MAMAPLSTAAARRRRRTCVLRCPLLLSVATFAVAAVAVGAFRVPPPLLVRSPATRSLRRRLPTAAASTLAVASHLRRCPPSSASSATALRGFLDDLFGDDDDDDEAQNPDAIPPELREEIYRAEANAPAARGRQRRVIGYILLTVTGVTTAFFNAFLTDLRFGEGSPSDDLAYYGFSWVNDNVLLNFAFTNKIGGALGLLGAGLAGTLAEVELRSKKENAEKIWAEMRRRRKASEEEETGGGDGKKKKKKKKGRGGRRASRRDMTGTQKKRLSALEELMVDDEAAEGSEGTTAASGGSSASDEKEEEEGNEIAKAEPADDAKGGILGSIQGFYEKADAMAASQALLLNKELEDRGMVEKITDETGLRVVGREAAKGGPAEKVTKGEGED
ncbi:hypothetical protein ACHAWF_016891 [Thalassiosira exigua]